MEDNYEIYKTVRTSDEFFSDWEEDNLKNLTLELKEKIYKKYVVKCAVLQRDNFKCQNEECITPESPLTMHHIKFQKNGGEDKLKNCITICKSCHKAFHRGKRDLTFWGKTYRIHQEEEVNWKEIKAQNKQLRKSVKDQHSYRVSWDMIAQLLKFLFDNKFDEDDFEEDPEE